MNAPPALTGHQPLLEPAPGASTELAILASADWPAEPGAEPPPLAGFIESSFSPLAAAVAEACLLGYFGAPPGDPGRAEHTAIVLASTTGDVATAAAVARAVDEGRRVAPLLFYQSNPNAVAGYIAARWGLAGPVVCTVPASDTLTDALASATLLIEAGEAAAALVIVADQGPGGDRGTALLLGPASWPSGTAAGALVMVAGPEPGGADHGTALLVEPASWTPPVAEPETPPPLPRP